MGRLTLKQTANVEDIKGILPDKGNKIPKIIHYCWFGGKPIPGDLQECLDTWEKLKGYTVMRWDESNCSFEENEFVRKTFKEKKLGFIGDYYRLKAVYEYGGIYLDTDVKVHKSFDPLLSHKGFLNFIFDCSVGTAILGSQKGNPFFKGLLDLYDNTVILPKDDQDSSSSFSLKDGKLYIKGYFTSNYYFTYYILTHYPKFRLNNSFQDLGDFVIYPKEKFEIGSLLGKYYAIHLNAGAWRTKADESKGFKSKIKQGLKKIPKVYDKCQIVVRKRRYKKLNKNIPFYQYSLAQKNGTQLPKL